MNYGSNKGLFSRWSKSRTNVPSRNPNYPPTQLPQPDSVTLGQQSLRADSGTDTDTLVPTEQTMVKSTSSNYVPSQELRQDHKPSASMAGGRQHQPLQKGTSQSLYRSRRYGHRFAAHHPPSASGGNNQPVLMTEKRHMMEASGATDQHGATVDASGGLLSSTGLLSVSNQIPPRPPAASLASQGSLTGMTLASLPSSPSESIQSIQSSTTALVHPSLSNEQSGTSTNPIASIDESQDVSRPAPRRQVLRRNLFEKPGQSQLLSQQQPKDEQSGAGGPTQPGLGNQPTQQQRAAPPQRRANTLLASVKVSTGPDPALKYVMTNQGAQKRIPTPQAAAVGSSDPQQQQQSGDMQDGQKPQRDDSISQTGTGNAEYSTTSSGATPLAPAVKRSEGKLATMLLPALIPYYCRDAPVPPPFTKNIAHQFLYYMAWRQNSISIGYHQLQASSSQSSSKHPSPASMTGENAQSQPSSADIPPPTREPQPFTTRELHAIYNLRDDVPAKDPTLYRKLNTYRPNARQYPAKAFCIRGESISAIAAFHNALVTAHKSVSLSVVATQPVGILQMESLFTEGNVLQQKLLSSSAHSSYGYHTTNPNISCQEQTASDDVDDDTEAIDSAYETDTNPNTISHLGGRVAPTSQLYTPNTSAYQQKLHANETQQDIVAFHRGDHHPTRSQSHFIQHPNRSQNPPSASQGRYRHPSYTAQALDSDDDNDDDEDSGDDIGSNSDDESAPYAHQPLSHRSTNNFRARPGPTVSSSQSPYSSSSSFSRPSSRASSYPLNGTTPIAAASSTLDSTLDWLGAGWDGFADGNLFDFDSEDVHSSIMDPKSLTGQHIKHHHDADGYCGEYSDGGRIMDENSGDNGNDGDDDDNNDDASIMTESESDDSYRDLSPYPDSVYASHHGVHHHGHADIEFAGSGVQGLRTMADVRSTAAPGQYYQLPDLQQHPGSPAVDSSRANRSNSHSTSAALFNKPSYEEHPHSRGEGNNKASAMVEKVLEIVHGKPLVAGDRPDGHSGAVYHDHSGQRDSIFTSLPHQDGRIHTSYPQEATYDSAHDHHNGHANQLDQVQPQTVEKQTSSSRSRGDSGDGEDHGSHGSNKEATPTVRYADSTGTYIPEDTADGRRALSPQELVTLNAGLQHGQTLTVTHVRQLADVFRTKSSEKQQNSALPRKASVASSLGRMTHTRRATLQDRLQSTNRLHGMANNNTISISDLRFSGTNKTTSRGNTVQHGVESTSDIDSRVYQSVNGQIRQFPARRDIPHSLFTMQHTNKFNLNDYGAAVVPISQGLPLPGKRTMTFTSVAVNLVPDSTSSPYGSIAGATSTGQTYIWDLNRPTEPTTLQAFSQRPVTKVFYHSFDPHLLIHVTDTFVRLFDTRSRRHLGEVGVGNSTGLVRDCVSTSDPYRIVTLSTDSGLDMFDLRYIGLSQDTSTLPVRSSRQMLMGFGQSFNHMCVASGPDGLLFSDGGVKNDKRIQIWSIYDPSTPIRTIPTILPPALIKMDSYNYPAPFYYSYSAYTRAKAQQGDDRPHAIPALNGDVDRVAGWTSNDFTPRVGCDFTPRIPLYVSFKKHSEIARYCVDLTSNEYDHITHHNMQSCQQSDEHIQRVANNPYIYPSLHKTQQQQQHQQKKHTSPQQSNQEPARPTALPSKPLTAYQSRPAFFRPHDGRSEPTDICIGSHIFVLDRDRGVTIYGRHQGHRHIQGFSPATWQPLNGDLVFLQNKSRDNQAQHPPSSQPPDATLQGHTPAANHMTDLLPYNDMMNPYAVPPLSVIDHLCQRTPSEGGSAGSAAHQPLNLSPMSQVTQSYQLSHQGTPRPQHGSPFFTTIAGPQSLSAAGGHPTPPPLVNAGLDLSKHASTETAYGESEPRSVSPHPSEGIGGSHAHDVPSHSATIYGSTFYRSGGLRSTNQSESSRHLTPLLSHFDPVHSSPSLAPARPTSSDVQIAHHVTIGDHSSSSSISPPPPTFISTSTDRSSGPTGGGSSDTEIKGVPDLYPPEPRVFAPSIQTFSQVNNPSSSRSSVALFTSADHRQAASEESHGAVGVTASTSQVMIPLQVREENMVNKSDMLHEDTEQQVHALLGPSQETAVENVRKRPFSGGISTQPTISREDPIHSVNTLTTYPRQSGYHPQQSQLSLMRPSTTAYLVTAKFSSPQNVTPCQVSYRYDLDDIASAISTPYAPSMSTVSPIERSPWDAPQGVHSQHSQTSLSSSSSKLGVASPYHIDLYPSYFSTTDIREHVVTLWQRHNLDYFQSAYKYFETIASFLRHHPEAVSSLLPDAVRQHILASSYHVSLPHIQQLLMHQIVASTFLQRLRQDVLHEPAIQTISPIGFRVHPPPAESQMMSWVTECFSTSINVTLSQLNQHVLCIRQCIGNTQQLLIRPSLFFFISHLLFCFASTHANMIDDFLQSFSQMHYIPPSGSQQRSHVGDKPASASALVQSQSHSSGYITWASPFSAFTIPYTPSHIPDLSLLTQVTFVRHLLGAYIRIKSPSFDISPSSSLERYRYLQVLLTSLIDSGEFIMARYLAKSLRYKYHMINPNLDLSNMIIVMPMTDQPESASSAIAMLPQLDDPTISEANTALAIVKTNTHAMQSRADLTKRQHSLDSDITSSRLLFGYPSIPIHLTSKQIELLSHWVDFGRIRAQQQRATQESSKLGSGEGGASSRIATRQSTKLLAVSMASLLTSSLTSATKSRQPAVQTPKSTTTTVSTGTSTSMSAAAVSGLPHQAGGAPTKHVSFSSDIVTNTVSSHSSAALLTPQANSTSTTSESNPRGTGSGKPHSRAQFMDKQTDTIHFDSHDSHQSDGRYIPQLIEEDSLVGKMDQERSLDALSNQPLTFTTLLSTIGLHHPYDANMNGFELKCDISLHNTASTTAHMDHSAVSGRVLEPHLSPEQLLSAQNPPPAAHSGYPYDSSLVLDGSRYITASISQHPMADIEYQRGIYSRTWRIGTTPVDPLTHEFQF